MNVFFNNIYEAVFDNKKNTIATIPSIDILLINKAFAEKSSFLDLGNCGLTVIPEEIIKLDYQLKELNLASFYFKDNKFIESKNNGPANNFSDKIINDDLILKKLELTTLFVSKTNLSENSILQLIKIKTISHLQISDNNLIDTSFEHISQLSALSILDISKNRLTDVGIKHIAKLNLLVSLEISYNKLTDDCAEYINKLKILTSLGISNNSLTEKGIEKLVNMKYLTSANFSENKTETLPTSILDSLKVLKSYFGTKELTENRLARIILMGNTTVGKSSLADYLVNETFINKRNSTHGIKIWKWPLPANGLTVNIWDFGGQDYYHATQTIFQSDRSLFLLLHTEEATHLKSYSERSQ